MIPLFLGLTVLNLLCLGAAAVLGYIFGGTVQGGYHVLTGATATLVCCAVHCVVFTYFAATAKWVQHAVSVKRLDPNLVAPTRSFKMQAFPAALLAMGSTMLAAFAGAAADNYHGRLPLWHHAFAIIALLTNLAAAVVEFRAIVRNGRLVDAVLGQIAALPADAARPQ